MPSKWRFHALRMGIFLIAVIFIAGVGCSSGDIVGPAEDVPAVRDASGGAQHSLLGLWQFIADPDAGTLDVVQLREGNFHLNALVFLEPPPLINLTLESLQFNGDEINAEIGLRHPFLGLNEFTGFDVCGILISNGTQTGFVDSDIVMAGDGDTHLLNPDGWSRWWNPAEFPMDGTMFGYKDGLLGTPDAVGNYNSTLNGYKYFCDGLGPDDDLSEIDMQRRGLFGAGSKNIRRYLIKLGSEGLVFNYAVDACWQFPNGSYPWKAPDDFAPEANRPEAYRISVGEIDKTLVYDPELEAAEGEVTLVIDVYDWFNADTNEIMVECGDIFTPVTSDTAVGGGDGYSTYELEILDAQPPTAGMLDLFITVASEQSGYQDFVPDTQVSSYFAYTMEVPLGEIEQPFPCGELYKEENFDSYSDGQYPLPAPWEIFWSGYPFGCRVTSEQSYSPPYSWRSCDFGSWARHDAIPMTRKDHFCYETRLMTTNINWHPLIGFAYKTSGSTSLNFCTFSLYGPDYNTYQWYHIYGEIDCIENTYRLWVDDELKVDTSWTDETREYAFTHFFIGTTNHTEPGYAVVYYDDVKFWVDS